MSASNFQCENCGERHVNPCREPRALSPLIQQAKALINSPAAKINVMERQMLRSVVEEAQKATPDMAVIEHALAAVRHQWRGFTGKGGR